MNTVFNDIPTGLEDRLLTMSNLPDNIVWENTSFTPTPGQAFIRVSTLPAPTTQTSIGTDGLNTQTGIFLVDSFYGKGSGRSVQDTFLSELVDHFKRGTVITQNGVEIRIESVYPLPSIEEDDWFHVPVQVTYISYTIN